MALKNPGVDELRKRVYSILKQCNLGTVGCQTCCS